MSEEYEMIFKIILIGDASVGKTNIMSKYLRNEFLVDSTSTVGVEFGSKTFTIENRQVKAQIWDTAGQERYRSITTAYYKGSKGAFVVYDITRKNTFESVDKWIADLRANGDKDMSIILIGNKSDLENKREISLSEARLKATNYNVAFMETSALNGSNIEQAFNTLMMSVYEKSKIDNFNSKTINHSEGVDIIENKNLKLKNENSQQNKGENNGENNKKFKCC